MAMQTGVSLSRLLILAGAGYTTTVLVKNGKFSEILGELQALVKGVEKSGEQYDGDSDTAAQVRRLAMEVRQLASSQKITVVNGAHGANFTSLVIPAATLGALGYGYMWWKGISFSDLMYVTKRNMASAVSNLTKHLEHVSEALSSAKRHLTQRLQNVDDKMDKQKELSKAIQENVALACGDLTTIEGDLDMLQNMISGLDGKIGTLEYKQDIANIGVAYLCNFIDGNNVKMPEVRMQEKLRISGNFRAHNLLTNAEPPNLKGLKQIAETLSGGMDQPGMDVESQDGIDNFDENPSSTIFGSASTKR